MTTEAIQAVVDRDEITVSEEGVEGASRVIELAAGRDAFTYDNLLPPDLAAASYAKRYTCSPKYRNQKKI